jgi:hypothetical protein
VKNFKGLVAIGFASLSAFFLVMSFLAGPSLDAAALAMLTTIMGAVSLTLSLGKGKVRTGIGILTGLAVLAFVTAVYLPPMWLIPEEWTRSETVGWHQTGLDSWEAEWETSTYTCYRGDIKLDFEHNCYWTVKAEKALQTIGLLPELTQ